MARVKKPEPTLEALFFNTPEQKVIKLLLTESTSTLNIRVLSSKLKGVRGLGGAEGLQKILHDLEALEFVDFLDNKRAIRLHDDNPIVQHLKVFSAICDLENLVKLLKPICDRGILFGSRSTGKARTDSDYDLFVVTDQPDEAKRIAGSHPLGKSIALSAWKESEYSDISRKDAKLEEKLNNGIQLWGSNW